MRDTGWSVLVLALGVAALSGCGGNVVVDPPGSAGGGGSGTGVPTSPPDPPSYCAQVCITGQQHGCLQGSSQKDCVDGCLLIFEQYPQCDVELAALYDCVVEQFPKDCGTGSACTGEALDFGLCVQGGPPSSPCEEYECDSTPGTCSCYGVCSDQDIKSDCKESGDGYYYCLCYANGEMIGDCDLSSSCGVLDGCCADYFYGNE